MKIVIVGGGTAGWLSALFLANRTADNNLHDITVIDSSKLGIIGAGEGSTGSFVETLVNRLKNIKGLNLKDFHKKTNSTIKMGIHCKNWHGEGESFYEPLGAQRTFLEAFDLDYILALKYGRAVDSSAAMYMWEQNKVPFVYRGDGTPKASYSYHFDAHRVGEYFKELALLNGVKHIDGEIHNLVMSDGELKSVEVKETNETLSADMWIDCSGFRRVLIGPMGGGWVDYSKWLPANRAMTYLHQYQTDEVIVPETLALALPNGWMWQIPTQERYGCGYVYSNKFITDEQAHKELEENTGRKIDNFRIIPFEPGRCERTWIGNVLAVGLSSHFLEPLEATSIHLTCNTLESFCSNCLHHTKEKTITEFNVNLFNKNFAETIDDYRDLIQMHYITRREDSPFWKYMKYELEITDRNKEVLNLCKIRVPSFKDFSQIVSASGWGVWSWLLAGLGHISDEVVDDTIYNANLKMDLEKMYKDMQMKYSKVPEIFYTHNEFLQDVKSAKI
jgi:tryptophan halogenase